MRVETELGRSKSVWLCTQSPSSIITRPQAHSQPHKPLPVRSRSFARSVAFDRRGSDVYGGYKNDEYGSPRNNRPEKNFVITFLEENLRGRSNLENSETLLPKQVNQQSLWRVGGLNTESEGVYQMSTMWYRSYVALAMLGGLQAFTTWVISQFVGVCWKLQKLVVEETDLSFISQAFVVGGIKTCLITFSVFVTWYFAPNAAGSGIPELRAILGGLHVKKYFRVRTLLVKVVGLSFALGSGLPLGLEGPFIHISAILARQFTSIKWFRYLDRKQLLLAACAGGLSSCFAAPIGGVLFSVEVTVTYFEVTSYWTTFCCAAVASCIMSILHPSFLIPYETEFGDDSWSRWEIPLYVLIGLIGGFAGSLFTRFHEIVVHIRRRYQKMYLGSNPFAVAVVVTMLFTTVCFCIGEITMQPARSAVPALFDTTTASLEHDTKWGSSPLGMYGNLIVFTLTNFVFTALTISLSIPCGMFVPVFIMGAAIGRLIGELLKDLEETGYFMTVSSPAVYAVVGAAAMASGVTKTISPAVIAMELTTDSKLALPLLVTVTVSCGVCSHLIYSFYDSILQLKNIPLLPFFPSEPMDKAFGVPRAIEALDVMNAEFKYLPTTPKMEEVREILKTSSHDCFPIVHCVEDMVLVGEIRRETLKDFLEMSNDYQSSYLPASNPQPNKLDNTDIENQHYHSRSLLSSKFIKDVNVSPIQVVAEMSLVKIYTLFHVLKPENIYVTKYGRLVGVVHENDLLTRELEIQLSKRYFWHRFGNFLHRLICCNLRST